MANIQPQITKIVITGGPCAGKSSALRWIKKAYEKHGNVVLFVPETATELISGGVAPWTCGTRFDYQRGQLLLQLKKEEIFEEAARTMDADKVLIVCDRGTLDGKAYMDEDEFARMIAELNLSEDEMRRAYDAVFHLTTAAKGPLNLYTTANNSARTETVEEAIALDDKLIRAWTGHPHLSVIESDDIFERKMAQLISAMNSYFKQLRD